MPRAETQKAEESARMPVADRSYCDLPEAGLSQFLQLQDAAYRLPSFRLPTYFLLLTSYF
jgi:hypothetical protein